MSQRLFHPIPPSNVQPSRTDAAAQFPAEHPRAGGNIITCACDPKHGVPSRKPSSAMKSKCQDKRIGGGRKLKDYPAVPDTPPPEPKKDKEVVRLEKELEKERVYLSTLQKENKEIEKILSDLEKELNYVKNNFPHNLDGDGKIHADNEHWFKYEAQMEVNRKLERERRHLESEIKQMEDQGMINLDSLTQSELILYVKQLERTKTDLLSDLRAKEWSLDKQAKDYHHLNETKRALEAEIKHYDGEHALFHHYKRISCPSAGGQKRSARKPGRGRGEKAGSVSQENLATSPVRSDMFRSLDESKLEELKTSTPVPTRQKRMVKEVSENVGKRSERGKIAASLPELSEKRSKTPPAAKTEEAKEEQPEAAGEGGFKAIATEPIGGSKFTIIIRIVGRIVSKPSAKCTIKAVEATVNPR